jgi:hypothetical protein
MLRSVSEKSKRKRIEPTLKSWLERPECNSGRSVRSSSLPPEKKPRLEAGLFY